MGDFSLTKMLDPGGFITKKKKPGKLEGTKGLEYQDEDYISRIEEQYKKAGDFNQNLVDQSFSNQSRAQNQMVINQLQDQASGKAPSMAEMLLTKNAALNNQNAAAQIANATKTNPALAARLIMQNNQANNFGTAQEAASARVQEQQAATQTLANVLNAQRQMDLSQSSTGANVGMSQQQLAQGLFGSNLAALQNRNAQLLAGQAGQQASYQQDVNRTAAMQGGLLNAAGTIVGGLYGGPAGAAAGGAAGNRVAQQTNPEATNLGKAKGGMIEGSAPKAPVDSHALDTVPTMLSPQEIVIPRSIVMGKNAPQEAKKFVEKILAEKSPKKMASGGKVGSNSERIAELERQIACIPGMKGRPKKMADGGVVGGIQDLSQTPGSLAPTGMPSPQDLFAQRSAAAKEYLKDPNASLEDKVRAAQQLKDDEMQAQREAEAKAQANLLAQQAADQKTQEDSQKAALVNEMVLKHGGTPVDVPSMAPQGVAQVVPASMTAETAPSAPSAITPAEAVPASPLDNAMANYMSAANNKFAADSNLAQMNVKTQEQLIADLEAKHLAYKAEQDNLQKQSDALYDDVVNQKVDPGRFWSQKSTGDKIGSTIAIALSGIGNAISASAGISASNGALAIIEKNIDRDIEAQKENINSKNNLYRMNLQRLGDSRAAESATQAQMLTMATAQMSRNAAIVGTDMAKATRDEFKANAQIKIAELNNQTIKAQSEAKKVGGETFVPGVGRALDPMAAKEAREISGKTTAFLNILDDIQDFGAKTGRTLSPEARGVMDSKIAELKSAYKEAKKLGTLDAGVERLFDQLIAKPTDIFQTSAKARIKSLRDNTVKSAVTTMNQYMLDPADPSFFASMKEKEINEGIKWAKEHPNDPRAKEILTKLGVSSGQ